MRRGKRVMSDNSGIHAINERLPDARARGAHCSNLVLPRGFRWAPVAVIAGLVACGSPDQRGIDRASQSVIGGEVSTRSSVVFISFDFDEDLLMDCSGVLITPRIALTAKHCVTHVAVGDFVCSDTEIEDFGSGAGYYGDVGLPEQMSVYSGPTPDAGVEARVVDVIVAPSPHVCRGDMAALILADELPLEGAVVVRGDAPPALGETVTAAGFGVGETNASTRREVTNVRINRILDGAFTVGGGILCYGDSGGPAFSEDTGALVGVYSRKTGDCFAKETENRFVTVSSYKSVVEQALEQTNEEATWEEVASGGASPVVETPEEKETDPAEPPDEPEAPEDPSTTEESGDGDAFKCSTAPHSEPPPFSRLAWLLMGLLVFRRFSRRD